MSQTAREVGRIDLTQNIIGPEFQPDRFVKTPNGLILLDLNRRRVGQWVNDTLLINGGFGTGNTGLFDPIDIVSSQLDLLILDRSNSRISRYDTQLNLIYSISLLINGEALFPTLMSLDSRGRNYIYSPDTHEIYRTGSNTDRLRRFIDLNTYPFAENCVSSMRFGQNDGIAILFDCANELHLLSRTGKLERRFKVDIEKPNIILPFIQTWLILNRNGDIQFLEENPFVLPLKGSVIKDALIDKDFLHVLTEDELIIFDINVYP